MNRIGNNDVGQRGAVDKSTVSDGGDRIGDGDISQLSAVGESIVSNGGDGIGGSIYCNRGWDFNRTTAVSTIGHGGGTVSICLIDQRIDRDRGGLGR